MTLTVNLEVPDSWTPGDCYACPYMYIVTYETEDDGYDDQLCCGIDNTSGTCPLKEAWKNRGI